MLCESKLANPVNNIDEVKDISEDSIDHDHDSRCFGRCYE